MGRLRLKLGKFKEEAAVLKMALDALVKETVILGMHESHSSLGLAAIDDVLTSEHRKITQYQ